MTTPTELPDFDALWDYGEPAATEARFRELLPQAPPGSAYQVELLTQIARTQGLQRQFDQAHATLDQAEVLVSSAMPRPRLRYLLERGRVFNSSRQPERAAPLFREAWEAGLAAGEDGYAVDAAHMLGICLPPDHQVEWHLKALDVAENSTHPGARRWLGPLYNNLGWARHDQGDYAAALDSFERGLRWREAQEQVAEARIARWSVARALRSLQRIEEALALQNQLLAEHQQAGTSDGYVHEELGECLRLLGRPADAQPHFARAFELLSPDPWLAQSEQGRLERLKTLSAGV